jgi:hypothetical protein
MKRILYMSGLSILLQSQIASAQISINSANLPTADDTLVTQTANLLTEVNLESTGENFFWDFSEEVLQIFPNATEIICYDVDETPLAYQFLFNNPFLYPNHNSDYGIGVPSTGMTGLTIEDAYLYHKNSGGVYSVTGMGASINGIPLAAQKIDPEVLFTTPLNYETQGSSHSEMEFTVPGFGFYGQTVDRSYNCDGWGTMSIAGSTYDVLRVRSEVTGVDSVYAEMFSFGLLIPRPATVEYTWYSPEFKVPLLQIISAEGQITSITTAPLVPIVSIAEIVDTPALYPNPANNIVRIPAAQSGSIIYDHTGKIIAQLQSGVTHQLNTSDWAAGLYLVLDQASGQTQTLIIAH